MVKRLQAHSGLQPVGEPATRTDGFASRKACSTTGTMELAAALAQIVSPTESPAVSKLQMAKAALRVELHPLGQPVYWCEPDGKKIVKRAHNPNALNCSAGALVPEAALSK